MPHSAEAESKSSFKTETAKLKLSQNKEARNSSEKLETQRFQNQTKYEKFLKRKKCGKIEFESDCWEVLTHSRSVKAESQNRSGFHRLLWRHPDLFADKNVKLKMRLFFDLGGKKRVWNDLFCIHLKMGTSKVRQL